MLVPVPDRSYRPNRLRRPTTSRVRAAAAMALATVAAAMLAAIAPVGGATSAHAAVPPTPEGWTQNFADDFNGASVRVYAASCHGVREPRLHDRPRPGLRRAELVAFGVLHDPPVPGRSLVDLADAGCPQLFQPGHQLVEAAGLTVDVDV